MADRYQVPLYFGDTERLTLPLTHGADGADVDLAEVSTVILSLVDRATGTVLRNEQDALNANNVTVTDGELAWAVQITDTAAVTAGADRERHAAEFTVTLTDGQRRRTEVLLLCTRQPVE